MEIIKSEWYNANEVLPAHIDWVIVRCINKDEEDFYFMAIFGSKGWSFFDEYSDEKYKDKMNITHWMLPPNIG